MEPNIQSPSLGRVGEAIAHEHGEWSQIFSHRAVAFEHGTILCHYDIPRLMADSFSRLSLVLEIGLLIANYTS